MEKNTIPSNAIPKTGIAGLKENFSSDILSGFLVFLLALPLSLGIAKASGFPASMGVLTAMVGGLFTSLFNVSALTIKGPAAGLITICSAAILAMGGSDADNGFLGWHLVCGIIVAVGLIQVVFSYLKLGNYSEFFPTSAVHGMLAAIGLIIIAKQIPVLLGDAPAVSKGLSPLALYTHIPDFIANENPRVAIVGGIALAIMFLMPLIKHPTIKKVPAPLIVLLVTVPIAVIWSFKTTQPDYILVTIGDFWKDVKLNADFSQIATVEYWKYVFIFLFVNSLESLLTVKAIDGLDPYKRKSDYNGDLRALGLGNSLAGLLGGLPMISEVVRSSANVNNGGKTKWSNFFHGAFLLVAMIFMIPIIELIPNAALAAMLIYAGYRLASPKTFRHSYKVGFDQFIVFVATIFVTLLEDLLMGIAVGIIINMLFQLYYKMPLNSFFKAQVTKHTNEVGIELKTSKGLAFTNYISFKKYLDELPDGQSVVVNLAECRYIDHSVLENLHTFAHNYNKRGGHFVLTGLEQFTSISDDPLSGKYKKSLA